VRGDKSWACLTRKRELENYLHPAAIAEAMQVAVEFGDTCDVPAIVARKVHEASASGTPWEELDEKKRGEKVRKAKHRLNEEAARRMTADLLRERDPHGEVREWFQEIALRADPQLVRAVVALDPPEALAADPAE
jgi:hypothetical protein